MSKILIEKKPTRVRLSIVPKIVHGTDKKFTINVKSPVIRIDPVYDTVQHVNMFVHSTNLPTSLPSFNVRTPNLNLKLYRRIVKDLLVSSKPFHLNNKGIIALADKVTVSPDGKSIDVDFGDLGVIDGSRTWALITANLKNNPNQYVDFKIITRVPQSKRADMAEGLNSSLQVRNMSMANFRGEFDFIKKALRATPYYDRIYFEEGEARYSGINVLDIVNMMLAFNVELYPNNRDDRQPVIAYGKREVPLKIFRDNLKSFRRMTPIIEDLCLLRDYVEVNAVTMYADAYGKKAGALRFVDGGVRDGKRFLSTFSRTKMFYRLSRAALMPLLGSLRAAVKVRGGKYGWYKGSVRTAKELFGIITPKALGDIDKMIGHGTPDDVAKISTIWTTLHLRAKAGIKEIE